MTEPARATRFTRGFIYGLLLGLAAAAYNFLLAMTGLYANPALGWGVLVVEFAGLGWILAGKGFPGRDFGHNLALGALAALAVGLVLVPAIWLQWTFVAPEYADVAVERATEMWRAAGVDEAGIAERAARLKPMYTPARQATFVFTGTLMTCLPFVLLVAGARYLVARGRGA